MPVYRRIKILSAVFCLGIFSILAQMMLMREMLVAFFGNEISIGVVLGSWLFDISLGAFFARFILYRFSKVSTIRGLLSFLLIVMAFIFPFQIYAVRIVRIFLHIPMGEYASFNAILFSSLIIFFPTCFCIGVFFPFACNLIAGADSGDCEQNFAVSMIYTFEAVGSMLCGAILTYVLLTRITYLQIVIIGSSIALIAAVIIGLPRIIRYGVIILSVVFILNVLIYPDWLKEIENKSINARWRAFKVNKPLREKKNSSPETRLLYTIDTVYQNLAVTESENQFTLYSNGEVMFVFPDLIEYEHNIHFLMAQKPEAEEILLIGGNPVGDIPELLKYSIKHLFYVEIDPGIGRIIEKTMPKQYESIMKDPRIVHIYQDAPRFVQRCTNMFDVVIIKAPEPMNTGANRFYTLEFYKNIKRILAETGFIYTSVTSSERLQSEAVNLGASVYKTLKKDFPIVLVTAEAHNRFIAGYENSYLTFNRKILVARSRSADVNTKFFRPEYFSGADEIEPEKTKYVIDKFSTADVSENTNLTPITYFHHMILWAGFSESGIKTFLEFIKNINPASIVKWLMLFSVICLIYGVVSREIFVKRTSGLSKFFKITNGGWSRFMVGLLMASTGFCGMALEILLIFVFQNLYGYVYTMMGLIVGVFMFGMATGALSGKVLAECKQYWSWLFMLGMELLLLMLIIIIPILAEKASMPEVPDRFLIWTEIMIYCAVALTGWLVGSEFPLGNRMFRDTGVSLFTASAITDASDHMGAAIGCLVTGIILVPVLGIKGSCIVLAAMKCAGILFLISAFIAIPRRLE